MSPAKVTEQSSPAPSPERTEEAGWCLSLLTGVKRETPSQSGRAFSRHSEADLACLLFRSSFSSLSRGARKVPAQPSSRLRRDQSTWFTDVYVRISISLSRTSTQYNVYKLVRGFLAFSQLLVLLLNDRRRTLQEEFSRYWAILTSGSGKNLSRAFLKKQKNRFL